MEKLQNHSRAAVAPTGKAGAEPAFPNLQSSDDTNLDTWLGTLLGTWLSTLAQYLAQYFGSVLGDDRAAKLVTDAGGDHVHVLADSIDVPRRLFHNWHIGDQNQSWQANKKAGVKPAFSVVM